MSASPVIRLKAKPLIAARKAAGLASPAALAEAMGCHRATLHRVISGRDGVGATFIARLLCALPQCTFDDLFDVPGRPKAKAEAPAEQVATVDAA